MIDPDDLDWLRPLVISNKEIGDSPAVTEKDWRMIHGHPVNIGGSGGGGGSSGGGKGPTTAHDIGAGTEHLKPKDLSDAQLAHESQGHSAKIDSLLGDKTRAYSEIQPHLQAHTTRANAVNREISRRIKAAGGTIPKDSDGGGRNPENHNRVEKR